MTKTSEKPATKRAVRRSPTAGRKKAAPQPAAPPPADLVARRAYEIFIEQGAPHGRDLDHWLAAEAELSRASA